MPAGRKRGAEPQWHPRVNGSTQGHWNGAHWATGGRVTQISMARSQRRPQADDAANPVPGHSVDTSLRILPNIRRSRRIPNTIAVTQVCSDEYMHPRYWSLQREQSAALQREEPHAAHGPSGCPPQPLQMHPPHCVQFAQSRHGDCGPRQGIPVTSTPNREASCTHDKQRPCWHTSHV